MFSRKKKEVSEEVQEVVQAVAGDEKTINKLIEQFDQEMSDVSISQKIAIESSALDALFVRRFKKFQSVQEYLEFLKLMKFNEIYKEYKVDLDSGDLASIDAYCKAALGKDRYEKEYYPVSIVVSNDESGEKEDQKKEGKQPDFFGTGKTEEDETMSYKRKEWEKELEEMYPKRQLAEIPVIGHVICAVEASRLFLAMLLY